MESTVKCREGVCLHAEQIDKIYPGTKALDQVSFDVLAGKVNVLIGENGAGKSTLMKIIAGIEQPSAGTLYMGDKEVAFKNTTEARKHGIGIIHQELSLFPNLNVYQNIFMAKEKKTGFVLDNKKHAQLAAQILERLEHPISPDTLIGDLRVGQQQMIEIARNLIADDLKILIMDEPTSSLSQQEVKILFKIMRELLAQGISIVYISHRLEELQHIVDRVIIMRDGKYITQMPYDINRMDEIIANMVGHEIKEKFPRVSCEKGKKILEVKHLNAGRMVRDINLELYEGEIVGIAGLMGAGRTETTRAIFGIDPKESGEIFIDGKEVKISCPADSIKAGLVLAPEDRKKDGLCTRLSIADNIALPNLDILCEGPVGTVNRKKEKAMVDNAVKALKIKLPNAQVRSVRR